VKQVHQHRLAAPDTAPQIKPAHRIGLAPQHPPQQAAARRGGVSTICLMFIGFYGPKRAIVKY
jgi:hypothetical protein